MPLSKEQFINLARVNRWQDIPTFLKEVFPNHYNKDFAPFHYEIFKELREHNRIAIAAPRKHGKSEIVTFGWVMWNLIAKKGVSPRFFVLIGNNYNNALKFLLPIKEELEHNDLIKEVFGDLKSDKWSENEIELTSKKKVVIGGNDFKIRGQKYLQYRPDMVIIDDAEDDELVRSDIRRQDFEHWLLYGVEPAMSQDNNQIVTIGTILHRDSQLSKLTDGGGKYKDWFSNKYMALNDGVALWERAIPKSWLEEEQLKDPYKFAQEYQNNPVPFEHAMFKPEYFDDYKKEDLPKNLIINITVDLACTNKTYSDYTVIMPVGIDPIGDLWILPYFRDRYTDPDKIIEQILNMYEKYANTGLSGWKFGKVGIEKTGFQRFLINSFIKERKKRKLHFSLEEIEAKGDKVSRIARLQPWFSAKDIHIRPDMLDLKEELLDFPRARHDDVSDCLSYHLDIISQKPVLKEAHTEDWKVTPERQRLRVIRNRLKNKRPLVYNTF